MRILLSVRSVFESLIIFTNPKYPITSISYRSLNKEAKRQKLYRFAREPIEEDDKSQWHKLAKFKSYKKTSLYHEIDYNRQNRNNNIRE